jgi:hypothetical protein
MNGPELWGTARDKTGANRRSWFVPEWLTAQRRIFVELSSLRHPMDGTECLA